MARWTSLAVTEGWKRRGDQRPSDHPRTSMRSTAVWKFVDGCYAATLMTWADPLAVAQAIGPRCDFPGELAAQHPRPTSGTHRARPAASLLARSAGCDPATRSRRRSTALARCTNR